jgi:predicted acylesterase/phospholipase RssA
MAQGDARDDSRDDTERGARIGLALAGGGPEGAVYEIGALLALDEAVDGLDLADLHVYVGVSAGAFVAACLANGLTPRELRRALVAFGGGGPTPIKPETFFTPAGGELGQRLLSVPRLFLRSLWNYLRNPQDLGLLESLTEVSRALPVGLFDGEPIRAYLARLFSRHGRSDDFRRLARRLVVVAADLDSGQAVRFGEPGFDHVPISLAVQASSALPGLYPPVEIEGRSYVDGVLHKTLHASVALEAGADLVLCINPIVPVDTAKALESGVLGRGKLVDRGLPAVMSQTLRTLIRSRLQTGLDAYARRFPGADVVLFEPRRDDYQMFFTNIFSFSERRAVFELAYRRTREDLLARRETLEPVFARHGLRLRLERLQGADKTPWHPGEPAARPRHRPAAPVSAPDRRNGAPAPRPIAATTPLTARLHDTLDRLEALLEG